MRREERTTGFFDEPLETMTAEERQAVLDEKLRDIVEYAYEHAVAFREKMDASGLVPSDIRVIDDLEKLPITRRGDLVEAQARTLPFGGYEAVPTDEMRRIYVSPGPVYEPGPWEYKETGWAQALFAAGFRKKDIVQNTFNYHMWPFAFILDDSLKMIGCSVVPTGAGNSLIQLTIMQKLKTTGLVGTPSFLMSLAQRAESQGMLMEKDFSLEVGFVSAEMFPESLRTLLEKKLGIRISQAYGTVTTGCIGYECPEKGGMHVCEDIIVEIVDPDFVIANLNKDVDFNKLLINAKKEHSDIIEQRIQLETGFVIDEVDALDINDYMLDSPMNNGFSKLFMNKKEIYI